jgi:hypothetical protein
MMTDSLPGNRVVTSIHPSDTASEQTPDARAIERAIARFRIPGDNTTTTTSEE